MSSNQSFKCIEKSVKNYNRRYHHKKFTFFAQKLTTVTPTNRTQPRASSFEKPCIADLTFAEN